MSGTSNGNGDEGPAFTPPAFVRQLDERTHDLTRKYNALKSMVGANHLASMHEIGALSDMLGGVSDRIGVLEKMTAALEKMGAASNKLLLQIFEKLNEEED